MQTYQRLSSEAKEGRILHVSRKAWRAALTGTLIVLALNGAYAEAREYIRIVGSSTVFPFATTVAERFGRTTNFLTPIVESTGSGGGFKLFCAGFGVSHPDITNASRTIKNSERKLCFKNGVKEITEVKIGYDGIVVANTKRAPRMHLTLRWLFLALAKEVPVCKGELTPHTTPLAEYTPKCRGLLVPNPHKRWSDIDPSLPDTAIKVFGPPPTSGTRDAFVELAFEGGCKTFSWLKALKQNDKPRYKKVCHTIREDGVYVEAGENDNLIIQKLLANASAFGIFGFSYLDQNWDRMQGSVISGITPTFENISSGEYGISRSLYFYVKNAHADTIPGIREYVKEFTSERAWGPMGYLEDKGLIPLPNEERRKYRNDAEVLRTMPIQ